MNCKYECNSEIKKMLRTHDITYKEIAAKANYSVQTIKEWMRHVLTSEREQIIRDTIEQIREERRLSYED